MVRADRIARVALGLCTKAVLGFLGLAILFGGNVLPADPADPSSSSMADFSKTEMSTVTLRVRHGALADHLKVVDATGRELAVLTHWISGTTTVVTQHADGAGVSYHLSGDGSVQMRVEGTARVTLIDAGPDGRTRVSESVNSDDARRQAMKWTEGPAVSDASQLPGQASAPDSALSER